MFQLPIEIKHGVREYKLALEDYIKGKMGPDRFKGIRVPWGFYSQRKGVENNIYMARVRIPGGIISSEQLKILAILSEKYGNNLLHLTTRQDIQIHGVKIEDTGRIVEELLPYNLSPRGGGGNTVRNIIACEFSGVCGKDCFNCIPIVESLSQHFLRDNSSFTLPRKYKIAFSGCQDDCAGIRFNDLGFMGIKKDQKNGFRVWAGGGMGANSRLGDLLEEFILPEEVPKVAEAIKRVFFQYGNRKDKNHARIRFLIEELGWEKFRELYKKEKNKVEVNLNFGSLNEVEKKNILELRIPQGDIKAERMKALAKLKDVFPNIGFRLTFRQNIALVGFSADDKKNLDERLGNIFSGETYLYPRTSRDVVVCAGASTCNLGLCDSRALGRELEREFSKDRIKIVEGIEVNINGCPNACGHHPQSAIGFSGMVKRIKGRSVPFYKVFLDGRKGEDTAQLSREVGIIPARRVPELLADFFNLTKERIKNYNDFYLFLKKEGKELMRNLVNRYCDVPDYEKDRSFYRDWEKENDFTLSGIAPGECGAGVIDMIESDLKEAEKEIKDRNWDKALHYTTRALLIVRGIEARTVEEAIDGFIREFIEKGIADKRFRNLKDVHENLKKGDFVSYIEDLYNEVKTLYRSMDNNFDFPDRFKKEQLEQPSTINHQLSTVYDLRGTPCPMNYVKAKLKLEELKVGNILEIYLDDGEPIQNVPKSLKDDGQEIVKIEKIQNYFKVVVKKKV